MSTHTGQMIIVSDSHDVRERTLCRRITDRIPGAFCQGSETLAQALAGEDPALVCLIPPVKEEAVHTLTRVRETRPIPVIALLEADRIASSPPLPTGSRTVVCPDPDVFCDTLHRYLLHPPSERSGQMIRNIQQIRTGFVHQTGNPRSNVAAVAHLLARLLPAAVTMYNRVNGDGLETVSAWPDTLPVNKTVPAAGHLCTDTVAHPQPVFVEVHGLGATRYAKTDPLVRHLNAQTYIARNIFSEGTSVGSLCALFTDRYVPTEEDRALVELLADLLGQEEERIALRESEHRYLDLLDNLPVGVYRTTPDGRVLEVNRELVRILGYPDRATLLATNVNEMFDDRRDREAWISTVEQRGTHHHARYLSKTYDGAAIWVEDHGRAVCDEAGRVRWFEGIMVDISDRVELEEELYMAQKLDAIGRLAGGFAHEFNNLLTVINGYADMMLSQTPPSDPNRDRAAAILKAGQRAARLISQLLAYGQKQMIQPRAIHPGEQITAMADMIQKLAGERIRVTITCDNPLPDIKADPNQLEQVILNLAHNSIAAIRERPDRAEGTLTIHCDTVSLSEPLTENGTTVETGNYVRITVSDTGVGIDPDIRPLIFEPFFTTKEIGQGSGLGLSTVYGILRQNGGTVTVQTTPGKGSTFRIYWPVLPPPPHSG